MSAIFLGFALLSSSLGQPPGLIEQLSIKATGQNGYEDYLRAADLTDRPDYKALGAWLNYRQFAKANQDKKDEEGNLTDPPVPPGLSPSSSELEVRRARANFMEEALELVRAGNRKPVSDPRTHIDALTLFPELAKFKELAKGFVDLAYVRFADGKSAQGTDALIQTLEMGNGISHGALLNVLVGIACDSLALAAFEAHLDQLSLADARRVETTCRRILGREPAIVASMRLEKQFSMNMLGDSLRSPAEFKKAMMIFDFGGEESTALQERVESFSAQDLKRLANLTLVEIAAEFDRVINALSRPEASWTTSVQGPDRYEEALAQKDLKNITIEEMAMGLASIFHPISSQAALAELRSRTQIRLLLLHAKIIEYRWQNAKVPEKLLDATDAKDVADPMSGEAFKYEAQERNRYRLFSVGRAETGDIELKYRRPIKKEKPGRADDVEGIPPPLGVRELARPLK